MVRPDQIVLRLHAAKRMLERGVSITDLLAVINSGSVIEDYPSDTPFHSHLSFAMIAGRPLHVVWAQVPEDLIAVITTYEPNLSEWDETFTRRRP